MTDNPARQLETPQPQTAERQLTPAAKRALAEAEARRKAQAELIAQAAAQNGATPKEINGRGGLDPARYGDWEVKGIISDF